MKKRILSLAAAACLILSLAACGDKPSLESYLNSDEMQSTLSSTVEQFEAQGMGVEVYAEGDELRYEFTISSLTGLSDDDRALYAETLQAAMDAVSTTFEDIAAQVSDAVSNDSVTVVVTYLDGDGGELFSQSFSPAEAE